MEGDHALLNACVLGRLFDFVDVNTLKTSRLVCRSWNFFAGTSLRKRTATTLKRHEDIAKFNAMMDGVVDQSYRRMKTFSILLFSNQLTDPLVLNLLTEYRNSIESLEFRLFPCEGYNQVFANALTSLPFLEELTISNISPSVSERNLFGSKRFPKLKSCTLFFSTVDGDQTDPKGDVEKEFLINLLQACDKTLQKLHLARFTIPRYYSAIFRLVNLKSLRHLVLGMKENDVYDIPADILVQALKIYCPHLERFECCLHKETTAKEFCDILGCLTNAWDVKIRKRFGGSDWNAIHTVPTLPRCRNLSLLVEFKGDAGHLAGCFPNLRKLELLPSAGNSVGWMPMESLEELNIGSTYHGGSEEHFGLNHVNFPCLTKLTAELRGGYGKYLFAHLLNLKELIVTRGSTFCDEDITGIPSEKLSRASFGRQRSVSARTQAYVGRLKNLQVLCLESPFITDHSIKYGISDIKSLTNLTLRYPEARVVKLKNADGGVDQYPIPAGTYKLNLDSLMLPNVPQLVQFTIVTKTSYNPVNDMQIKRLLTSRQDFRYSKTIRF